MPNPREAGNPVIWHTGMAITDEVRIIKAAEPAEGLVLKASVSREHR